MTDHKFFERGSTTIYFAILSASFISVFALVMASLLRMQQTNETLRQASLASDFILSYYDSGLEKQYGLLAYHKEEALLKSAFEPYFGSAYRLEVLDNLSSLEAFQNQAVALGQMALAQQTFEQLEKQSSEYERQIGENADLQREVKDQEGTGRQALDAISDQKSLADQEISKEDSEILAAQKRAAKGKSQAEAQRAKELFRRLKNKPQALGEQGEASVGAQEAIDSGLYNHRYVFKESTGTDLKPSEQLWFTTYLLTYFNHRLKSSDPSGFKHVLEKGEVEYLLGGNSRSSSNYFNVYARIFAIREGINLMHLSRSPKKMKVITEASLLVSTFFPIAEPLLQAGFMGLWASLESSEDLKVLLRGDSISLLKLRESEWQTDFDGSLDLNADKASKGQKGLNQLEWIDYKGYLTLLLSMEKSQTLALRAMTLIDLNFQMNLKQSIDWKDLVVSHRISVMNPNGKEVQIETSYLSNLAK